MVCASCGVENRGGSKFCDNCGSPLAATCPHCGAPNRNDARFCATCGQTLATDSPAEEQTPTTPASAERRLVTVLFADLVGFTSLAEARDPEAVRDLLSKYFETATEIVELHGGTVEKFIGDAVMAVWGTPTAREDDAERAVRAALELVDAVGTLHPSLQARAGVLTGEAAVTLGAPNQGMVAGDLVNTAARLQSVADPGTVLVGEATRRAAESAIIFEPVGDHSLKGKTSPVPAWRALRVVAQRGGRARTDTLEAPFVGRDEELRQLKDLLHAVGRDRRARLVSITGPGGIGKSRLVWELEKYIDGVSEDIYWHRGRSPSYGEGITFWALGEMVRRRAQLTEDDDEATTRERIAVTLDEYVEDEDERERIGPALLTLLGVEEAPAGGRDALFPAWRLFFERIAELGTTVLVFEDLQWADTGLLDFIDHLLDWSKGLPIMVVSLARPELFDRRPDWGANRRNLTSLALEPLTDDAMRELLNGLVPGLPEEALAAIVGRAEGMPLYAVETVRGLLADGRIQRNGDLYEPTGDLSQHHRAGLAPLADRLAAGRARARRPHAPPGRVSPRPGLLRRRVGRGHRRDRRPGAAPARPGAPRAARVEADPRSPERGQYRFVQSLIQEVAYGTLARRDRRSRHLAVARHYEGIGDDEMAGALASHYLAARDASDEGAEADAVSAQARLALVGAADRAARSARPTRPSATSSRHLRSPPTPMTARRCWTARHAPPPTRPTRCPALCRGGGADLSRARRPLWRGRSIRPLRSDTHRSRRGTPGDRSPRGGADGGRRGRLTSQSLPRRLRTSREPACGQGDPMRPSRWGIGHWQSRNGSTWSRSSPRRSSTSLPALASSAVVGRASSSPARPSSWLRSSAWVRSRCACETTSPRRSSTMRRPKRRGCSPRHSISRRRSVTAPSISGWRAPSQAHFTKRAGTGTPTRSSCGRRSIPPPCEGTGRGCSPFQRCMRLRAARISPSGRSGFVTSLARPQILTSS